MSEDTPQNGSTGRFERMEAKLDILITDLNSFKLDAVQRLTRLETASGTAADVQQTQATKSNLFWIKFGTVAAGIIGLASLALKIFG